MLGVEAMLVSLLSLASGDVVLSLARPDTRGTEARGDMVWGADGDLEIENNLMNLHKNI